MSKARSFNELSQALAAALPDLAYMPKHRETAAEASRALRDLSGSVVVDVLHRTQVGACIPFTVLPKHYHGKRVRIVIDEGSDG